MNELDLSAEQRLRYVNYEAKYGGYAEHFRKMDRQIVEMQKTVRSMQAKTFQCHCTCHEFWDGDGHQSSCKLFPGW